VVEAGGALRLAAEAFDEARIARVLREQHLHRDGTIQQLIAGEVHLSHSASCDAALDLVSIREDVSKLRHRAETLAVRLFALG
jgi:hypothetical protein